MKRFEKLYGVTLTKNKQREIILILMALEAIFAFSYLGYIELDVVSTTTLHIIVIVGAMTLGISASVPIALVFVLNVKLVKDSLVKIIGDVFDFYDSLINLFGGQCQII